MNELFPIVGGLLAGLASRGVRRHLRFPVLTGLTLAVGIVATVASAEYELSWYFALIDTTLAFGAAMTAWVLNPVHLLKVNLNSESRGFISSSR
jgi:hypothetical protein